VVGRRNKQSASSRYGYLERRRKRENNTKIGPPVGRAGITGSDDVREDAEFGTGGVSRLGQN